jgi:outer membrane receptor protein involved in Fe transport
MLCAVSTALAQEEEDINFSEMSLEDLLNVEVTVASKSNETIADAPSSVTVYTRREIMNMGVTDVYELLNYIPGYQVTQDVADGLHGPVVQARGRRVNPFSTGVLFLIDGQRLNTPQIGGATRFTRFIPVENIKQVEVIRGPGSALYGSNAFLGVVNIVTADNLNEASIGLGNNGRRTASANASGTFDGGGWAVFSKFYSDDGQDFPTFLGSTTDPWETMDFYGKINYKNLTFNTRYSKAEFEDFFAYSSNLGNYINTDDVEETSFNLEYKLIDNDTMDLKLYASYLEAEQNAKAALIPGGVDIGTGGPLPQTFIAGPSLEEIMYDISLDLNYRFNERSTLSAGATFANRNSDRTETISNYMFGAPVPGFETDYIDIYSGNPLNGIDRDVVGGYFQYKYKARDYLTLIGGARWDDYSEVGSTLNPRGGLVYTASFNAKFKLLYGEAFRAPTLTELFTDSPVDLGNPNLEPEEVQTTELVYIQNLSKGQFSLTYFHNNIDNPILSVLAPDFRANFINGDSNKIEGVEMEFTAVVNEHFLIRGSYSSIIDGESPITYDQYGSLLFNYGVDKFNFNFNTIYRSDIEFLPGQDSYFLANAKLKYNATDNYSWYVIGNNVFDEDYFTYEQAGSLGTGVPNRGSMFTIGFQVTY